MSLIEVNWHPNNKQVRGNKISNGICLMILLSKESKIAPKANNVNAAIIKYPFTLFSVVPICIEDRASKNPRITRITKLNKIYINTGIEYLAFTAVSIVIISVGVEIME